VIGDATVADPNRTFSGERDGHRLQSGGTLAHARILADHVLDADSCEYSGLPKLLNVVDYRNFREARHPINVVRETGATTLLDGGNTTGIIAAYRASEATIHRVQVHGLAIVCLGNVWMGGGIRPRWIARSAPIDGWSPRQSQSC
jgi:hypothetical protein